MTVPTFRLEGTQKMNKVVNLFLLTDSQTLASLDRRKD